MELAEPTLVLLYFPALIAVGAGTTFLPGFEKMCVFLGKLAYPLYMIHYAAIWIFGSYFVSHKPDPLHLSLVVVTGVILLVGFSYLVLILYGEPIRCYLAGRRILTPFCEPVKSSVSINPVMFSSYSSKGFFFPLDTVGEFIPRPPIGASIVQRRPDESWLKAPHSASQRYAISSSPSRCRCVVNAS